MINQVLFGYSGDTKLIEGKILTDHIIDVFDNTLKALYSPLETFTLGFLSKFGLNPQHNAQKKRNAKVGEYILKLVDELKKGEVKKNSYIGGLIKYKKNNKAEFTDKDMIGNAILFVFASFSSTLYATGWAIHHLSKHKQEASELRKEAIENKVLDKIDMDKVDTLRELDAFVKEILRCYPPFAHSDIREPVKNLKFGDTKFRKGDYIMFNYLVNQFKETAFKNASKFDRKRHYDPKFDRMDYVPFGVGPRVCIGQDLAKMVIKMGIVVFLRYFDSEFVEGFDVSHECLPMYSLNKFMVRLRLRNEELFD